MRPPRGVGGLFTLERDLTDVRSKKLEKLGRPAIDHSHKLNLPMRRLSHPNSRTSGRYKKMQILCEVNQAECFRRGIDAPRSTMKIEVDPAKLPEEIREFLADHLYEGDKLSGRDDFQLLRPDLLGFMETVLTAKEYKEASDHNHTQILFDEWIKGAGKDAEAKREKVAKELVDAQEAQEAHPVTSQETSVNTPGSIANLTRTLEMLSRKHEPKS